MEKQRTNLGYICYKEINKQARQNWAQLKLRQEIAAFQEFTQSVLSFKEDDLPRMLKDFQEIQKYKQELPLYKQELAKSTKLRTTTVQEVAALNKESFTKIKNENNTKTNHISYLSSLSTSWQALMMTYANRSSLLREEKLATSLYAEANAWRKIKDEIGNFLVSNGASTAKELALEKINFDVDYSGLSSPINRAARTEAMEKAKNNIAKSFFQDLNMQ